MVRLLMDGRYGALSAPRRSLGPRCLGRQPYRLAACLPLAGPEQPDQSLDRASGRLEQLGSNLANVRYDWVFRHGSSFHQFLDSAEHRGGEAGLAAGRPQEPTAPR